MPSEEKPVEKQKDSNARTDHAAFRDKESVGPERTREQVRPSGPESMRTRIEDWDEVDEASDESFPASDPPAKY